MKKNRITAEELRLLAKAAGFNIKKEEYDKYLNDFAIHLDYVSMLLKEEEDWHEQ